jgi:hypothetical protein
MKNKEKKTKKKRKRKENKEEGFLISTSLFVFYNLLYFDLDLIML